MKIRRIPWQLPQIMIRLVICCCINSWLIAATPQAEKVYVDWLDAWYHLKIDSKYPEDYVRFWDDLVQSGEIASFEDQITNEAMRCLLPENDVTIRRMAVEIMSFFGSEAGFDALAPYVDDPDLRSVVGHALLKSDRSEIRELAVPMLYETHAVYALGDDPRVRPWLYEELRDADPGFRFGAALMLASRFADSSAIIENARELLGDHTKEVALKELAIHALVGQAHVATRDLQLLRECTYMESNTWLRKVAFSALVHMAKQGDASAKSELEIIRDQSPLMQYRESAAAQLRQLTKQ